MPVPAEKRGLETLLGLLHRTITAVAVAADESLSLTLDGQVEVHVPRDPHYESWQVAGRGVDGRVAGPL